MGTLTFEYRAERTCYCVWRAVFRICLDRCRRIHEQQALNRTRCSLERCSSGRTIRYNGFTQSRLGEEYCADIHLVAKRQLGPVEFEVFRLHYLLGAEWRPCCREVGLERGNFFHLLYRIERDLGRAFCELRPYALFPVDEYFSRARSDRAPIPMPAELAELLRPLIAPRRAAAAA